jgi:hypothetical protein
MSYGAAAAARESELRRYSSRGRNFKEGRPSLRQLVPRVPCDLRTLYDENVLVYASLRGANGSDWVHSGALIDGRHRETLPPRRRQHAHTMERGMDMLEKHTYLEILKGTRLKLESWHPNATVLMLAESDGMVNVRAGAPPPLRVHVRSSTRLVYASPRLLWPAYLGRMRQRQTDPRPQLRRRACCGASPTSCAGTAPRACGSVSRVGEGSREKTAMLASRLLLET